MVVVGFGAAGACAALEAAATSASAPRCWCSTVSAVAAPPRCPAASSTPGGGTPQQRAAGVDDSPEAMFGYLRTEVGDAVPAATLQRSSATAASPCWPGWRATACRSRAACARTRRHTRLTGTTCTTPAANCPPSRAGAVAVPPAPRGHRTSGPRHLGRPALRQAGRRPSAPSGIRVLTQTGRPRPDHRHWRPGRPGWRARRCAAHPAGPAGAPGAAPLVGETLPVRAEGSASPAPPGGLAGAAVRTGRAGSGGPAAWCVAAGGFAANRPMMRAHAPAARGGLPLATPGDDGSGIRLGTGVGGATSVPGPGLGLALPQPAARPAGRPAGGPRTATGCATSRATAPRSARRSCAGGGRAWLLAGPGHARRGAPRDTPLDAVVPATAGLVPAGRRGPRAGPSPRSRPGRASTRTGWRPRWPPTTPRRATAALPDPAGKPAACVGPQDQPPYALIDCSMRPRLFYPAPDAHPGRPGRRPRVRPGAAPRRSARCDGLYAAGRSAVGLCSRSYVSGLSLADCVSPAAAPATAPRSSHRFREPKQTTDHMPAISQCSPTRPLRTPGTTATM